MEIYIFHIIRNQCYPYADLWASPKKRLVRQRARQLRHFASPRRRVCHLAPRSAGVPFSVGSSPRRQRNGMTDLGTENSRRLRWFTVSRQIARYGFRTGANEPERNHRCDLCRRDPPLGNGVETIPRENDRVCEEGDEARGLVGPGQATSASG